ncbi:PAS domain-containing sensor histidine kinase [Psychromarinibacter sp. C21-152]|uniref:histidine kinase n=1 Tax=Psychromarinibacter sediminicola TaxID=3033385 RepID=A0AAE3NUU5_9RHOB|nr:PAS domain-containing sensor histidine kinase [Psychromarinibacter sediminicola]MDF0602054.1 PAS domain-containing sensor histidine kinase [Psychromarinibacter sediminicola]
MREAVRSLSWERLSRIRRQRRVQNAATLGLVILGPLLAAATFLVLGPLDQGASALSLRLVLLADLIYVMVVAALVLQRVAAMIAARRARSAGSRLHLRLTGVFAILALAPAVLVAVFAAITVNFGLEGWFSDRVRTVLGASLAAAEAYEDEHRRDLMQDAEALADYLETAREQSFFVSDGQLRQLLTQGQGQIQRGLREAYVINSAGEIRARGERSYLFDFEKPGPAALERALDGETVVIEDWDVNEFRAIVALDGYVDRLLYVSRNVDGEILNLLDDTQETVHLYTQLESERGRIVFEFGLLYLGFAMILVLAAIWLGLWFAERLSGPVGRLAGAAQRVGAGDLDVHIKEEKGDDEIAMMGRVFNQMTRQLKAQRDTMLDTNAQIERRRRLFDSVLSSITAGVVGLDPSGNVTFINRSAAKLLRLKPDVHSGQLSEVVPEFEPLFDRLRSGISETVQEETRMMRNGKLENLLVRMATRRADDGSLEGYVVAFDDVTDLVSAQRMAAWGDVARRIAHEIKNPLTPIQLSAERIKRKFSKEVQDVERLDQMTEVIIRQTTDLRRIVDEFSKFARMPDPERRVQDLTAIVRDAVLLQEDAQQDNVAVKADLPQAEVIADIDATMISQALTNLIKNAGEAVESYREKTGEADYPGEVRVTMSVDGAGADITIEDNGIGLPPDRSRLFEPYVTTREKGTGLGLSIVKKIIEEHGGTLSLTDADPFAPDAHAGARAEVRLPLVPQEIAPQDHELAV